MRALKTLIAATLLCTCGLPAQAQFGPSSAPPGGRGGNDDEAAPGAYASPSAIPEGTADERFGIPRTQGRVSHEPIALPDGFGRRFEPDFPLPSLPAFAPQMLPSPTIVRPDRALVLNARLEPDGPNIPDGLVWRLFSEERNRDGQLQLMGVSRGGEALFDVPAGTYLLHVGFGRAGVTKRIDFSGLRTSDTVTLQAGGLRLSATPAPGSDPIRSDKLTFDVFAQETPERERQLVAENVPADVVLRLNAGAYEVVSKYGETRARADIRVETGRTTSAQLQHHAAEMTMKLVRETGGEAIADTAWSIVSAQGDLIRSSLGAFASVVLAEGDYLIIAKNRERTYQRELSVQAGQSEEVELLIGDATSQPTADLGSGD